MEINLTAIWEKLTAPVRWLINFVPQLYKNIDHKVEQLLRKRARSRRKRSNKLTPSQKKLQRVKMVRLAALALLIMVVLSIASFFGLFAYYSRELPQPGQVVRREGFSTKIYDRNGKLLYDLFADERRDPVSIDQIPQELEHATVAIEDKDFYEHVGFDLLTILRIPYNLVVRRRLVGGSTLTQQLVKNVLLTNERTISRKFKEFVLALQIERTFDKDQILEMYLNEAPYGGTAWGVEAAANLYFNQSVSDLNLIQSAFLAGLPQRPSAYSPFRGKKDADGQHLWMMRTKGVLRRMNEDDYIDNDQYNQALDDLENMEFERQSLEIKAPHFVFYVKEKLTEMYGEGLVEQGGLRVTTTLDLDLHEKAQEIVAKEIEEIEDYDISNGASLAMNPRTGEVLAMVGSRDYFDNDKGGQFNVVTDGLRQPGSSIKPITYLAMFQQGYTPATMLADVQTDFRATESDPAYTPRNYDGQYRGPVSLRNSLGSSLNVPAVKSLALVGVENFLQLAYDMGFESLAPTEENLQRFGLALTLGGGEVHMIDTVSAYSAFANGGTKIEPVSVLKVEDREGNILYEHHKVEGRRVMTEAEAFLINDILSDNNARLMAFGPNSLLNTGKPIAVKTGTTNDMKDNWTIGWSQEIIVGAWVGNNDNTSMKRVASGITGASPIWRETIFAALDADYEAPAWEQPDSVEEVEVDSISGYPNHDEFPSKKDYVIKGTLPSLPDPIHKKVKVCGGENKLATPARIARGDYDKREVIDLRRDDPVSQDGKNRWMEGIQAWVDGQDDSRYDIPTEYCGDEDEVSVKLEEPDDKEEFDEEEIEVHIKAGSGAGIREIELWVDDELIEKIEDDEYKGKIKLDKGQHEVYAKAFNEEGDKAKSAVARIGTGGASWEKPEPTKAPEPTKKPEPTEDPEPTAAPTATPNPRS